MYKKIPFKIAWTSMFLLFYTPVNVIGSRETVINRTHKNLSICKAYIVLGNIKMNDINKIIVY